MSVLGLPLHSQSLPLPRSLSRLLKKSGNTKKIEA